MRTWLPGSHSAEAAAAGNLSRTVSSSQRGIHPQLAELVRKHLRHAWRRPIAEHSRRAYEGIRERILEAEALVLDAGCGTGEAVDRILALQPGCLVIAVDKSGARLRKAPASCDRALFVRADLADFWRLLLADSVSLQAHYLLHPNPWPKARSLSRRWHGHPVFPTLLALGGELELRSNWGIYVSEFASAVRLVFPDSEVSIDERCGDPWTQFERKYMRSGQRIFRCRVSLPRA